MLYDEPFSALDPLIRRDMQDEVMRLQERDRQDDGLHHPRPARGAPARRPDRDHARRRDRAARDAAEELVGSPADDYVENFVRDVPRSHVLTLRWIMRPAQPRARHDRPDGRRRRRPSRDAMPVIAGERAAACARSENGEVRRRRRPRRRAEGDRAARSCKRCRELADTDVVATPLPRLAPRRGRRSRHRSASRDRRRDGRRCYLVLRSRATRGPAALVVERASPTHLDDVSRRGSSTSATARARAS